MGNPGLILVIGASGKTGRAVSRALAARGVRVRAGHRPDLDLETGHGLAEAMDGVDAVYHLAPNMHPDEVAIAHRVATAALDAGVPRFVFHSVLHPDDSTMPHHWRKHLAEQRIRQLLPTSTIVRPAAYHENLLPAALEGRLTVPYSIDSPFTNVALDDLGEAAAGVLTEAGHEGADYDLVGPEVLSVRDMARIATEVLGREVTAETKRVRDWVDGPGAGLTEQVRDDLLAMFASYDKAGLVGESDDLARLLGRPATTWAGVLEKSR